MYYKNTNSDYKQEFSNKDIIAMIIASFQIITPYILIIFIALGLALGLFQIFM